MIDLNPKWLALSSLFYEGRINYDTKLTNYERLDIDKAYTEVLYNIYSLPIIRDYLRDKGYTKFVYEPFIIDIDIEKSDSLDIGTYTVKKEDGGRIQISGAMMMPWYFVYAERES